MLVCAVFSIRCLDEDEVGSGSSGRANASGSVQPVWLGEKHIAVDEFALGISTAQAFEIAKAKNLTLTSDQPPRKVRGTKVPCRQGWCSVSQVDGNWIGVGLLFDADRLTKIKVSVPDDADSDVKKANIAQEFKGLTYRFFNNYSESLRNRIFGHAEGKETPVKVGDQISALAFVEYNYPKLGIVVHTTIDKRDHPPKPFDLEVEFVAPADGDL